MRAKCVETFAEQRSPTWHHLRLGRITGSRFAAAGGFCPFTSPKKFYNEMTGEEETFKGNVATAWGTEFEPEAIAAVESELGDFVVPAGFCISERDPWLGVSPDGWLNDGKTYLELKCPFSKPLYDEIPHYYLPQIIGGMAVTGRDSVVFACYIPDNARNAETGREPGLRIWRLEWSAAVERYWKGLRREMFSSYQRVLLREGSSIEKKRPKGTRELIRENLGEQDVYAEIVRVK